MGPKTSEWILAISGIINLVVSILLWHSTRRSAKATEKAATANSNYTAVAQKTYQAVTRPWVGPKRMEPEHTPNEQRLTVYLRFVNVGTLPALNLKAEWDWFVDGNLLPRERSPRSPGILFPQQEASLVGFADEQRYLNLVNHPFEVAVKLEYENPDAERYVTTERWKYNWDVNQFFAISGSAT